MDIKEIRYINLRKNIGKRILMELLLSEQKYPKKRVEGVAWKKSKTKYISLLGNGLEDYVKAESMSRQNGVIGCWIAHTNAIQGTEDCDGIIVVLEDDFVCQRDFFKHAIAMVRQFHRDFDVILFDPSGSGPKSGHFVQPGIYDPNGYSFPYYFGSHCLFINSRSIPKILKVKEHSQVRDYDGFLLYKEDIKSYVFYTGKSGTVSIGSDISGKSGPLSLLRGIKRWLDFRGGSYRNSMPFS